MLYRSKTTGIFIFITICIILYYPAEGYLQPLITSKLEYYESPQNYAFELRFGLYRPDVDEEFGGEHTPYKDIFGTDTNLLFGAELDWQITSIFIGTLGIGGFIGYFRDTGNALLPGSNISSEQEVTFNILPLELLVVIRIDWLADNLKIPLVPYLKSGLCYYIWWSDSGGKLSEDTNGNSALGGIWGYKVAGGLMLRLDQFDIKTAKDFDREWGVNHSYLFFEWYWAKVNNFEQGGLSLGDSTWSAGIALEF